MTLQASCMKWHSRLEQQLLAPSKGQLSGTLSEEVRCVYWLLTLLPLQPTLWWAALPHSTWPTERSTTGWPDSGPSGTPHRGLLSAPLPDLCKHTHQVHQPYPPLQTSVLIFLFLLNFELFCDGMSLSFLLPLSPFLPSFISFLISVNLKDLRYFSPTSLWMGTFVFSANNVESVIVRAFLQSFVLRVVLGFVVVLFWFFFLLCDLQENMFKIISRFYLNVVFRVNFLYWSLYWWVHATGNKILYKSFNQNHCALLRLCLSLAFCPPHRRLLHWTK